MLHQTLHGEDHGAQPFWAYPTLYRKAGYHVEDSAQITYTVHFIVPTSR
jgi:hypothetical protein